jgi:hypothetical protein
MVFDFKQLNQHFTQLLKVSHSIKIARHQIIFNFVTQFHAFGNSLWFKIDGVRVRQTVFSARRLVLREVVIIPPSIELFT